MHNVSFQTCTENPSYFSEKCSQCRFSCLNEDAGQHPAGSDAPKNGLSVPGIVAVVAGAAASIAGYPMASAGLTILGAAAIISRILGK